jgi:hypothetical protein
VLKSNGRMWWARRWPRPRGEVYPGGEFFWIRIGGARRCGREFLTHQTTCASEMLEKTTCEIFYQKRPPVDGGTPGQATRGTCRLGQCRQAPAAVRIAGMWPGLEAASHASACRHAHWRHSHWRHVLVLLHRLAAEDGRVPALPLAAGGHVIGPAPGRTCRQRQRQQGPAGNGPGGTCHVSPGLGVPPLVGGLF